MQRVYFGIAGLLLFVIGLSQAYDWSLPRRNDVDACPRGVETGISIGGPFELVNHLGETVTHEEFYGKYMLIYFGFTFCPDTCPIALETMSVALDQMGKKGERVRPVFISVDPERDTPEAVKDYIAYFRDDFIGLTGSLEQVEAVAQAYRVFFTKDEATANPDDYLVNHTSIIYLMDPEGEYISHFTHNDPPEKVAARITSCMAVQ